MMMQQVDRTKIVESFLEVSFSKEEDFRKVKETLTRIGIASWNKKTLVQSCHILHKQGKYYITHFKEMFKLDGKPTDFTEEDVARRNTIANLLNEWGMFKLVKPDRSASPTLANKNLVILSYDDSRDWNLVAKYDIGKKRFVRRQ